MTHVKRIRQSIKYPETKVDIIVTSLEQYEALDLEELTGVVGGEFETGFVQVPQ